MLNDLSLIFFTDSPKELDRAEKYLYPLYLKSRSPSASFSETCFYLYTVWFKLEKFDLMTQHGFQDLPFCDYSDFRYYLGVAAKDSKKWKSAETLFKAFFSPHLQRTKYGCVNIEDVYMGLFDCARQLNAPILAQAYAQQSAFELLKKAPIKNPKKKLEREKHLLNTLQLQGHQWIEFELKSALLSRNYLRVVKCAYALLTHHFELVVVKDLLLALSALGFLPLALHLYRFFQRLYPQSGLEEFLLRVPHKGDMDHLPGGWHWWYLFSPFPAKTTLSMICKNEAHVIQKSLDSVEAFVDEIIVFDTGSKDGTLEILKRLPYKNKIEIHCIPWDNNFAEARNKALAKSTGDWILSLDADEFFSPTAKDFFQSFLAYRPVGWQIFNVLRFNIVSGQVRQRDKIPRVFANHTQIQFFGALHNYIGRKDIPLLLPQTDLPVSLYHTGYAPLLLEKQKKSERYSSLEDLLYLDDQVINPYYAYHLGWKFLYQREPAELEKSLTYFELSLSETLKYKKKPPRVGWQPAPTGLVVLCISRILSQLKSHRVLIERFDTYQTLCQESEFYYLVAKSYFYLGDLECCLALIQKTFSAQRNYSKDSFSSDLPLFLRLLVHLKKNSRNQFIDGVYSLLEYFPDATSKKGLTLQKMLCQILRADSLLEPLDFPTVDVVEILGFD